MGSVLIECSGGNTQQTAYYNRGPNSYSAAHAAESSSRSSSVWKFVRPLHAREEIVNKTLNLVLDNYHSFPLSYCYKRKLTDGLGQLSRFFFGTAMNEDMKEFRDRFVPLGLACFGHNKPIHFISTHFARVEQHVPFIVFYAATFGSSLNTV